MQPHIEPIKSGHITPETLHGGPLRRSGDGETTRPTPDSVATTPGVVMATHHYSPFKKKKKKIM
jgi:hypothetical protein